MSPEKKYLVARLTEQLADHCDLPPEQCRHTAAEIISEAVDLRSDSAVIGGGYDFVHESNGDVVSRKPSNVDVTVDFETGLLVVSEISTFASGDPIAIGGALAGLGAIVIADGTITLSDESAYVYAIAVDRWGVGTSIAQDTLLTTVIDESAQSETTESLSPTAIKDALDELETAGCLSRDSDTEETQVVLEEHCTTYWS